MFKHSHTLTSSHILAKAIGLLVLFCFPFVASTQAPPNLTAAEYFIDTDPGFGKAITVTLSGTNAADKSVVVNLNGLPDGIHNLYLRAKDANGKWSVTNRQTFYRLNIAAQPLSSLTAAEYFIDTDPGFGKAITVTLSGTNAADKSVVVNLNGLTDGVHNLYIRAKDATGKWSVTNRQTFYRLNISAQPLPALTAAEYFIDTDPGFGKAITVTLSGTNAADKSVVVNLNGLPDGIHNIYLRAKDANGKWSVTNRQTFYRLNISAQPLPSLTAAEYFIDTDPGFGKAITVTLSGTNAADKSLIVNLNALPDGIHNLYLRAKDANGKWSVTNRQSFYRLNIAAQPLSSLTAAEYFIDTDPGFGKAITVTLSGTNAADKSVVVNLNGLPDGIHNIYVRAKDAIGKWSVTNRQTFYRLNIAAQALPNLVKAEYFIDTDPGFGKAQPISFTATPDLANLVVNVNAAGVTAGKHRFYIRALDAKGNWSITNTDTFNLSDVIVPELTIGNLPAAVCAGDTITLPYTLNTNFGIGNTFTAQLSNASGDFTNPVNIGIKTSAVSGSIIVVIPAATPAGNNYRIRVNSTSPIADSKPNSDAITVRRKPENGFNINGETSICFGSQTYTISPVEAGVSYTWKISGGGNLTASGTTATVNWNTVGNFTLTGTPGNSCGNGLAVIINITLSQSAPQVTPGISITNRTLTASALVTGATSYQWYKDGIPVNGATAQNLTVANSESGNYTVAYTNACGKGPQSSTQVVPLPKTDQIVTFTNVAAKTFGDPGFTVTATASSGLPITTYSIVSGPAAITGNTINLTGAGTVIVKAYQAGNAGFNEAEATLNITVNKGVASIILTGLTHTYDGTGKKAIAITNPLGLNTGISYNASPDLPVNAGVYAVSAIITSPNYTGTANAGMLISKASQTINLQAIGEKSFNDAPFNVLASAGSGLPVTLSIVTVPATGVASISGNVITMLGGGGTVTINASQAGSNNYNAATTVSTDFTVKAPSPKDVQVVSLLKPAGGCGIGSQSDIKIRIKNTGTQPATGITVSYEIDNGSTFTENVPGTIPSGGELDFTFSIKGNFPLAGNTYGITVSISLAGDEKPDNNTLAISITRPAENSAAVSKDTSICLGGQATLTAFGGSSYQWTGGPSTATYSVSPVVNTSYDVTIADINGCSTIKKNVTVTVNPVPAVNAGPDQSMLKGSSVTLTASGTGNFSWNTGETTAQIAVSPSSTGSYTVMATNLFGCQASDEVKVTVNFSAISVSPGVLNFGSVVEDSTAEKTIVITNTGTLTETLNSLVTEDASAPFFTAFSTPVSLPAGASISIPVRFTPAEILFYFTKYTLNTTAGNFNISLQGRGVAPAPAWTISPANYHFGNIETGSTAIHDFVISNLGNIPIIITTTTSGSTQFSGIITDLKPIPVGGKSNLRISFNPAAVSAYTGIITIRTATMNLAPVKVILAGNGYINGALPGLEFLTAAPFNGNDGVTPAVGQPGMFTYRILYKHPDGLAPMAGSPRVGIDKNGDEDFADIGEGILSLDKETTGSNWVSGEVYSLTTALTVSDLYGYQFFATDVNGNDAPVTEYRKGPLVTREILDLHIFADDIIFSKQNPAVNEAFIVTATIHNNSPYPASNVNIRIYYKDSLFLLEDIIPFIDGTSQVSITKTLSFSPDGFYPIKVWIDSAHTLGEGNLLNNYASRPVIVGHFTVPGTIEVVENVNSFGCSKGKTIFSGRAVYKGLNLSGAPPVEGATVTIKILNYQEGSILGRTLITHTNTNGEWYVYDDPCAQDILPGECSGYTCGFDYKYTVEVTDYTLTSPVKNGSFSRACQSCEKVGQIQHFVSAPGCILDGNGFTVGATINNWSYDQWSGGRICAPTVYKDTIDVYIDGKLIHHQTLDSIASCATVAISETVNGLPAGNHNISMTHVFRNKNNEIQEASVSSPFAVNIKTAELYFEQGVNRNGYQSVGFQINNASCWDAGPFKVFIYDYMPGYSEKLLEDSMIISGIAGNGGIARSYSNPLWKPGCHTITVVADARLQVPETNEDNNESVTTFCIEELLPDLAVDGLTVSNTAPKPGSLVNFTYRLLNVGQNIVDKPFKLSIFANGVPVGTKKSINGMALGEELQLASDPYIIPLNPCPILVTIKVDTEEAIKEIEEVKNNVDTLNFGVNLKIGRTCDLFSLDETTGAASGIPDTIIYCIPFTNTCLPIADPNSLLEQQCFPYYILKNVPSRIETTVRNTGNRDISNVKVRFTWKGQEIGTDVIPYLKAGQKNEHVGFSYAFDSVGFFTVFAYVDYDNEVCELNERDNGAPIYIGVKTVAADLQILSQHIAPSNLNPNPGQSITIVASILNIGDEPSSPAKVRFWVDGQQLGEDVSIDSIAAGMDTTVMATVTYQSDIVGPKIIKVLADAEFKVLEYRKTNNEATRAIIVGDAPDFASSLHEAITLIPGSFGIGDEIEIRNYIRNYGGATGTAWLKFYIRTSQGQLKLLDSVPVSLASNDSARFALKWIVNEPVGNILTEITHASPPEFNDLNNWDSLRFEIALPLKLLSFQGKVQSQNAVLNWKTASETNVSHFEVESSSDGNSFSNIGKQPAFNSSGEQQYGYTDINAFANGHTQWYYRLKMVDKDGRYHYSNTILLRAASQIITSVYPNPAQQLVYISVKEAKRGSYSVSFSDAAGRVCIQRKMDVLTGNQQLTVPVNHLAKGTYLVKIQGIQGETISVTKLVKE